MCQDRPIATNNKKTCGTNALIIVTMGNMLNLKLTLFTRNEYLPITSVFALRFLEKYIHDTIPDTRYREKGILLATPTLKPNVNTAYNTVIKRSGCTKTQIIPR